MNEVLSRLSKTAKINNGHLLRKEIIRFGKYQHPNPDFSSKKYDWEFGKTEARQLIDNFDLGLVDSVKYLDGHDEEKDEILGSIIRLEMTDTGVDAIIDIVDDKVAKDHLNVLGDGKALRSGVSVGLDMKFRISQSGTERYAKGPVLRHVASVTIPWINGLRGFEKVAAAYPQMNFGHKKYDGDPLIHEEDNEDMKKSEADQAIKTLAKSQGIDEEVVRAALKNLNKGKGKKKTNLENSGLNKKTLDFLSQLNASMGGDDDEDDDDDLDDDEDDDDEDDNSNVSKNSRKSKKSKKTISASQDPEVVAALSQMKQFGSVLKDLATGVAAAREEVEEQKKDALKRDAVAAVKKLSREGKILPKEREDFIELYCSNKELFDKMAANLEAKVEFPDDDDDFDGEDFTPSGTGRNNKDLSDDKVDELTKRYLGMVSPGSAETSDSLIRAAK